MKLALQTIASMLFGLVFFGVALFLPAGTVNYWQAWIYLAGFTIVSVVPSVYLARTRPEVLRRRMRVGPTAETRPVQRILTSAFLVVIVGTLVLSALDHRYGWSTVPLPVVIAGLILVPVGLGIAQLVVIQNSWAASTIGVEADQQLVSTGLYGRLRHPLYFGALIMLVATPPALDSLWGLLGVAASLPVFVARIRDEEQMLTQELAGYAEYKTKVRYRVVPYLW